jgi:RNA polymerase primary sigma factor
MAVGDAGGMTLGGILKDKNNTDPEELIQGQELLTELQQILAELNDREQRVMRLRFKLEGSENIMPDEVARELKLSRERMRQIEVQAIKKLRIIAQRRRLRDMLNK